MKNSKKQLEKIPQNPGVYFFKNPKNQILYIGKAANLERRVSQYFRGDLNFRISQMVELSSKIDFIKTDSEIGALLLESEMIKRYKPKYNIELKDQKNFLWVQLTTKDNFPKLFLVRQPLPDKNTYIGPFTDSTALRSSLKILRKIFPYINSNKFPHRTCLFGHLGMCPCFGMEKGEYQKNIKNFINFLKGKSEKIVSEFEKEMKKYSKEQDFEKAATLRDKIYLLKKIKTMVVFGSSEKLMLDADIAQEELYQKLKLRKLPKKIECYDVSNIKGEEATGSLVVFKNGLPDRKEYKKFKINSVKRVDDYAMTREVLSRRFKKNWLIPDLIMIDGGKGQIGAAFKVLSEYNLDIPLIGLAKKNEEVYQLKNKIENFKTKSFEKIIFDKDSPAQFLLERIRDEAHRFAITYHHSLREKIIKSSPLDGIEDIGPKTRKKLLKHFGSIDKMKEASAGDLEKIVSASLARKIKEIYNR